MREFDVTDEYHKAGLLIISESRQRSRSIPAFDRRSF
jgi:hypothetical protein